MPETPPYRFAADDFLGAPADADNVLPALSDDQEPADPARSEAEYRRQVIALLTMIARAVCQEAP